MLGPFSQIEQAWRDTLLHKAEGTAFDSLAQLYGVPRLAAFSVKAWRKALLAAVWGPRGTPGTTHAFLEGAFSDYVKDLTFQVRLYPAQPALMGYVSGGPYGGFKSLHVNRFVRIDSSLGSTLHWIKGPSFVGMGALQSYLNLVPFRTAYWDAADWTKIKAADLDDGQDYQTATATILPFFYVEASPGPLLLGKQEKGTFWGKPCTYQLFLDGSIALVPASYLQPGAGQATPAGMPYGGALLPDAFTEGDAPAPAAPVATPPNAQPGTGPYPIYLSAGSLPGVAETLDLMLPAGVQTTAQTVDFGHL